MNNGTTLYFIFIFVWSDTGWIILPLAVQQHSIYDQGKKSCIRWTSNLRAGNTVCKRLFVCWMCNSSFVFSCIMSTATYQNHTVSETLDGIIECGADSAFVLSLGMNSAVPDAFKIHILREVSSGRTVFLRGVRPLGERYLKGLSSRFIKYRSGANKQQETRSRALYQGNKISLTVVLS